MKMFSENAWTFHSVYKAGVTEERLKVTWDRVRQ